MAQHRAHTLVVAVCLLGSFVLPVRGECAVQRREEAQVVRVNLHGDLALDSGRVVRLAGVSWPRQAKARAKVMAEVSAALLHEKLIVGDASLPDRWGREAAQVFVVRADGKGEHWVQGQLVEDGMVDAWPEPAAASCWGALAERMMLARVGKLGVWAPVSRRGLKRLRAKEHIAKPATVLYEGVVRSVRKGRSMTFVNFAGQRDKTPSLFLPAKIVSALRQSGRDAATFAGKRIRVWANVEAGTPTRLMIASALALEVVE